MLAVSTRRNDWLAAFLENNVVEAIGIVGAIGDDLAEGEPGHELAGLRHVVLLTGTEFEANRQAESIYDGMKLGAEAAARAAESLGLRSPFYSALRRPGLGHG